MKEEFLKQLPLEELFDLMILTMNELLAMHKKNESKKTIREKRKEVELLQRIIVAKKAESSQLK